VTRSNTIAASADTARSWVDVRCSRRRAATRRTSNCRTVQACGSYARLERASASTMRFAANLMTGRHIAATAMGATSSPTMSYQSVGPLSRKSSDVWAAPLFMREIPELLFQEAAALQIIFRHRLRRLAAHLNAYVQLLQSV